MAFNINQFSSQLKFGGARPTLFKIRMSNPIDNTANELIEFMCESTSMPGSSISAIEVPYFGRKIKLAGDRTFEPWQITVINDEDFKVRNSMEAWHSAINGLASNLRGTTSSAPSLYKAQASVVQYGRKGEVLREYTYIGLFPTEISPIELDWNATDQIERFTVQFAYDYYEVVLPTGGNVV
jgi:hypothetical protein